MRASQVALVVKNTPAYAGDVKDAGSIPGLGRSLEKEMAHHSSILAWRGAWPATVHGVAKGWTQLSIHSEHIQQSHQILTFQFKGVKFKEAG